MSVVRPVAPGRGLVLLLAALTMVGPFTIDTIFPAFPAIQRAFLADPVAVQQTISVYLVPFGVMALVHGPLADALGRRPVVLAGTGLYAIASIGCAIAPTLPWLLAGRAFQGVVAGAGIVLGRAIVRDVYHGPAAQRAMSQMSMIFGLAPAAAPIVGGWLLGWWAWQSIFWFLAGLGLVLCLLAARLLPETHPPERRTPLHVRALGSAVVESARLPGVRRLVAVSAFNFAALFTYIAAAPALVVDLLGLGPGDFGLLFVPVVVAMITGSWLTGRLAGRLRPGAFLAGGFGISIAGGLTQVVLGLADVTRLPWVLVGPVATGLGIALVFPLVTLLLLDQRPTHRGTLSSLQTFSTTLLNAAVSGALVPLVSGRVATLAAAALGFSVAGATVWWWHRRLAHPRLIVPEADVVDPPEQL